MGLANKYKSLAFELLDACCMTVEPPGNISGNVPLIEASTGGRPTKLQI